MNIKKETVDDIKYIAFGIIMAILLNKALGLALGTDLPVVAVVSESMTHDSTTPIVHYQFLEGNYGYSRDVIDSWPLHNGFRKGDVLVVKGISQDDIKVGDVIVYNRAGLSVPIVHRVIDIEDGTLTTKGDHNQIPDYWQVERIRGEAIFRIPLLGWPKVILTSLIGGV
jgi:signal peptidase I